MVRKMFLKVSALPFEVRRWLRLAVAQDDCGLRPGVLVSLSVVVVVGILISTIRTAAQSQPQEIPGQAELKKGDNETAVKLLTAHVAANANDASAEKLLLSAYIETGRYVEAEASAKKFLLKNPGAGLVRYQQAEVLMLTG